MKNSVIIYSGGMDSTVLLHEYKDDIALAISFDYGSKHNTKEQQYAKKNCEKLGIKHIIIPLSFVNEYFKSDLLQSGGEIPEGHYEAENMKSTVVPFRNGIMLSIACGIAESNNCTRVLIANHAGDHCFSENTQILTPTGLKTINMLKVGDSVYSYNLTSQIWEKDKVLDILKKGIPSSIKLIETQAGNLELTEEHQVYRLRLGEFTSHKGYTKSIEKVPVNQLREGDYLIQPTNLVKKDSFLKISLFEIAKKLLMKYDNPPELVEENDRFGLVSRNRKNPELFIPSAIDMQCFVSVIAWYIAEGFHTDSHSRNKKASRFCAQFSQSIKANLDKVEYIIDKLKLGNIPVKYEYSKSLYNNIPREINFYFSNIMSIFMQDCGTFAEEKKIPCWLWDILLHSISLRDEFLRSLTLGDGSSYNAEVKGFCTTSPQLMSQVITLLQLSGYHYSLVSSNTKAKYISYSKKGRKQAQISLGDAKFVLVKNIKTIPYSGHVYDISVEKNHNFAAGDYGQHLISNSIYPDCRAAFITAMCSAMESGTYEAVKLFAPYTRITKRDIALRGKDLGVDFNDTYSCYKGGDISCGVCGTCVERKEALEGFDPTEYLA